MVIKYLLTFLSVIVIVLFLFIWSINVGTADPTLPKTFPKRTILILLFLLNFLKKTHIISANLLVNPKILVGFTALSVEIRVKLQLFLIALRSK